MYRRYLHNCRNKDINKIKINTNNSFAHELTKFILSFRLQENNIRTITEGIFKNNKRADIIDLTNNVVYEILHTETLDSISIKAEDYPIPIIPIKTDFNGLDLDRLRTTYDRRLEI